MSSRTIATLSFVVLTLAAAVMLSSVVVVPQAHAQHQTECHINFSGKDIGTCARHKLPA